MSILFISQAFSQTKTPLEELFKDVPLAQRQDKRLEFALRMGGYNNDTGYSRDLTPVLYNLNLKENPKHGPSWYYLSNKLLSMGSMGRFQYSPDVLDKADKLITQALQNAPDYVPLHIRRADLDIAMKKDKEMIRQNALNVYGRVSSESYDVLTSYGEVLSWLAEHEKASNVYKMAESKATTNEEKGITNAYRGLGAQLAGNYHDCVEGYSRARTYRKSFGEDIELISCLNKLKRFDEALAISNEHRDSLGRGTNMDCHVGVSNGGKGKMLSDEGKFGSAEVYLIEATKGCKNSEIFNSLATNYIKQNNFEKAKETILEGVKVHTGNKAQYLQQWSNQFKDTNKDLKLFFYEEGIKYYEQPKEKVNAYLNMMHELKNSNDPAFVDYSRRALSASSQVYESNRNDFDVVKLYGNMNTVFGVKRDSLIYLAKAREALIHAKSLRPEHDQSIEQNLSVIAQIETGIQNGSIKPSEP